VRFEARQKEENVSPKWKEGFMIKRSKASRPAVFHRQGALAFLFFMARDENS